MTSLKPIHWNWSCADRDKTCYPLRNHQGFKYFLNQSRPFIDHISRVDAVSSSKAFLLHHETRSYTHPINPFPEEEESIKEEEAEEEDINPQKVDHWVKDSAVEIVNNLDEAPFLVHVYCTGNGTNRDESATKTRIRMVKEKAIPGIWPMIEGRWKAAGTGTPSGVILVEELKTLPVVELKTSSDGSEKFVGLIDNESRPPSSSSSSSSSSSTKLWGILIQGKGKSCTACYLLKTTQVRCVAGLCTHFCLWKVECFGEHLDIQVKRPWLQMG